MNSLEFLSDVTVSEGGPLTKDTLWFFGSFHEFDTSDLVANTFFDDGSQGTDGQHIRQGSMRVTYQLNARNKLSGYYDKIGKLRTHQMGANFRPRPRSSTPHTPSRPVCSTSGATRTTRFWPTAT